jgi:hypothetical protein
VTGFRATPPPCRAPVAAAVATLFRGSRFGGFKRLSTLVLDA